MSNENEVSSNQIPGKEHDLGFTKAYAFLVHSICSILIFATIALAAVGLHFFCNFLEPFLPVWITWVLRGVESAIFVFDALLFARWLLLAFIYAMRFNAWPVK